METIQQNKAYTAPISNANRVKTIDMIRGVALLGILLMNITGFGIHWSIYPELRTGAQNTTDFYAFAGRDIFFSGTMRGLFSMLFGAGMILFTINKKDVPGGSSVTELYYRRLLWLILFGVINAYVFLWPGDILYFYGLAGMVLYSFRKLSAKWLFTLAIAAIFIGGIKTQLWYSETRQTRIEYKAAIAAEKKGKVLTEKQKEAKSSWENIEKNNNKVDQERVKEDLSKMHGSYATIFNFFLPRNSDGEAWGAYHGIWDSLAMMFLGMALFVLGFFSNKWETRYYTMALVIGYGIGIPIGLSMFYTGGLGWNNIGQYVDSYTVPHWVLYDFRRAFLCLGHASILMLIYRSKLVPWLMKALANVGQMAFTNYLMQSIICTLFFYGYGLDYYNRMSFHQLFYVVGTVWVFQLIFSVIWLKFFRFGPFEWLWRSLTYWKIQPMKYKSDLPPALPSSYSLEPAIWTRREEEVNN